MPNHFHLLIEVNRFSLSVIMQRLLTQYVKSFNLRHHRVGHLFQGRYKAILCQKDAYLLQLIRYVHLNPVRANLVKDSTNWRWSSHHEYLGRAKDALTDSAFPLSLFHNQVVRSRALYGRFVHEGIGMGHNQEFYPSQTLPCIGEEAFLSDYRDRISSKKPGDKLQQMVSLENLATEYKNRITLEILRSSSQVRKVTEVRREFVLQAVKMGHRPSTVAVFLNCSPSSVSKMVAQNV